MYKLSDFDYFLPKERIAQTPARPRDFSRLLVLERKSHSFGHRRFNDIVTYLRKGDLLVLNDTKVIPARLFGHRCTGGKVEVLLLEPAANSSLLEGKQRYHALIKPLARLKNKETIFLEKGFSCQLADAKNKIIEFSGQDALKIMRRIGRLPLPPYIRRPPDDSDRRHYQTVFAKKEGAVAAPTAGLHFTKRLLRDIQKKGVGIATLTLHVNYATFSPVRTEDIRHHRMYQERFFIPLSTVRLIQRTKKEGGRVFAVGTTVCKALEDSALLLADTENARPIDKESRLFIFPPFSFKVVDALITNFHLPRTSLLMLAAAFAGRGSILKAYEEALREGYRFYSYGDAMLIL
jgi:S-adenosylmethionine:tRNA ribosyltransferase-isomerase